MVQQWAINAQIGHIQHGKFAEHAQIFDVVLAKK